MSSETIIIIASVGLVLLIMIIRFAVSSAVNKGAQAIENAAARGSNTRNGPEVVALRELYPELAAQVLAQNGGAALAPTPVAGAMVCSVCGMPGDGNFCNECGAAMVRQPSPAPAATVVYNTYPQNTMQIDSGRRKVGSGKVVYLFVILVALFGLFLTVTNINPTKYRIEELEHSMEIHTPETDLGWYSLDKIEHDMLRGTFPIMIAAGVGYILMCATRKRVFALAVPLTTAAMSALLFISDKDYFRDKNSMLIGLGLICFACLMTLIYLIFDKLPIGIFMLLSAFASAYLMLFAMGKNQMESLMYMHIAGNAFLMFMLSIANKRRKRFREQEETSNEE